MLKSEALQKLGGTVASAAEACRISSQAVSQWPDVLSKDQEDRVLAALARKHLPPDVIGTRPANDEVRPQPIAVRRDGTVVDKEERGTAKHKEAAFLRTFENRRAARVGKER